MKTAAFDVIEVLIAELRRSGKHKGWIIVPSIDEIPEDIGHFAVLDGISTVAAGVTWNMRKSARKIFEDRRPDLPIFMFLLDKDGSAAEWLKR